MAATPTSSSQFVRLLDERLREVSEGQFNELKSMIPSIYRTINSDSAWEEFYSTGALPDVPEFNGYLSSVGVSPGFHTKIEPKEYAVKTSFERKLLDDKKYGVFDSMGKVMTAAAHRTMEKQAVRPLAYAFSAAFDFQQNEEGVAMCSSSHATKSGTSTTTGFSNAGTSALSKTSVAATRILMRQFRNDQSERISMPEDLALIVPDALYDTAYEICKTPKSLDTAEGNINPQYNRYDIIPYMLLDDYDANNWFMVSKSMMKQNMVFIDRIKPEIKSNIDFHTFQNDLSIYFRCAVGWLDWRHIYGHNVT